MADFDPYHKWLGITPKDQPANHYRLLGIDIFESDPDVIANAADKQMAHIRSFQTGQYSAFSQKLLNEIAAAKICLLNPVKKDAYDRQLRQQAAAPPPAPSVASSPAHAPYWPEALVLGAVPTTSAIPSPIPAEQMDDLAFLKAPAINSRPIPLAKATKSSGNNGLWIGLGLLGGVALVMVTVLIILLGRSGKEVAATDEASQAAPTEKKPISPTPQDRPEELAKHVEQPAGPPDDPPKEVVKAKPPAHSEKSRDTEPKHTTEKPPDPMPSPAGILRPEPGSKPKDTVTESKEPSKAVSPNEAEPKSIESKEHPKEKLGAADTTAQPKEKLGAAHATTQAKENPQKPTASVAQQEKRPALPDEATQKETLANIRNAYNEDYRDKATLAKKLLQKADENKNDMTVRFVVLQEAKRVAAELGQGELAFEAIDVMASEYDVSAAEMKAGVLEQVGKKPRLTPDQRAAIADAALQVIDEAMRDDNFNVATQMGKLALQMAKLAKDKELTQDVVTKNNEVEVYEKAFPNLSEEDKKLKRPSVGRKSWISRNATYTVQLTRKRPGLPSPPESSDRRTVNEWARVGIPY